MLETIKPSLRTLGRHCQLPARAGTAGPTDREVGLFAASLADGYAGAADKNHDGRLETAELAAFLNTSLAAADPTQRQRDASPA